MEIRKIDQRKLVVAMRKRVAAYARVSSGKDAMLHSLSAQVSYYSALIQGKAEWEYAGVYADEAITGTKDSRKEFRRLLSDCKAGKIDIVITKSISRFARNTITLLENIRELKDLGVDVFFEEQNIHTASSDGELMLTILASYAQEESRSASENCLWRIRERFKNGEPVGLFTMFGYRYAGGELVVCEEEAGVVRMIFADYLAGLGGKRIAVKLRTMGIPTIFDGKWSADRVASIIKNEKYTGNSLLQKSYTVDHLNKLRRANKGELPMYYAEETHPAIISQETFDKAQAIMESRRVPDMSYLSRYPFSSMIVCGNCGKFYKRKITHNIPAWHCSTYLNESAAVCPSVKIHESIIMDKATEALGLDAFDESTFKKRVDKIIVPESCRLIFILKDSQEITLGWEPRSRRESWTDEMREAARQRRLEVMQNG